MKIQYKSIAVWPRPDVQLGNANNESYDTHDTREYADAITSRLRREGFGGDGKIFPVSTRVEPVLVLGEDEDLPFEIIDHGVCHTQYFQGCGVSGSRFDLVTTGIGDSPGEAVNDALTGIADSGFRTQSYAGALVALIEASDDYKKCKASEESVAADQRKELGLSDDEDLPDGNEVYRYISIRYNTL